MLRPAACRRPVRARIVAITGATVLIAATFGGAEAASADTATSYDDLRTEFATSGTTQIVLGADVSAPAGALTLSPGNTTILDLAGHALTLQRIQLTTVVSNAATGSTLDLVDSVGGGLLTVDNSAATGSGSDTANGATNPAIEVDGDAGSALNISGASVVAKAPAASGASAAAIGGGTWTGLSGAAGSITAQDYVGGDIHAAITAVGSSRGAAIGAGAGAGTASIAFGGHTVVTASTPGSNASAAAIGGGASPAGSATGGPGVVVQDYASVTATAAGRGAAIGGGLFGAGGTVGVHDHATVVATGDATSGEAGIGDGDSAASGRTVSVTIDGASAVTATGGGAGGAGIGGGSSSYGGDSVSIAGNSTVVATGVNGPGIGGVKNRAGTGVSVDGSAQVRAVGGGSGAAIGGGDAYSSSAPSVGASLTTGPNTQLVLSTTGGASVLGGSSAGAFGSVANAGALTVPSGSGLTVPSGQTATSSGTFVNAGTTTVAGELSTSGALTNSGTVAVSGTLTNSGRLQNTGTVSGSGTVANSGTIVQSGTLGAPVTGNAFDVVYDAQGGSASATHQLVYAKTANDAGVSIASASPPSSGSFTGWNTSADGSGSTLGGGSDLAGLAGGTATGGSPVTLRVYARYQLAPVLPAAALPQGVVGTAFSASVAATTGTAPIAYSYSGSLPAGLSLDPSSGAITGTPTSAGSFTMAVSARNAVSTASRSYTIEVVPTVLALSVPSTPKKGVRYLAGASVKIGISGLQANEGWTITVGGKKAASGHAASSSAFTATVKLPKTLKDGAQTVRLTGAGHAVAAKTVVETAAVAKHLTVKTSKAKAHRRLVIRIAKLYPKEAVHVVLKGKHRTAASGHATAKGAFTLVLKKGLKKGVYRVVVTGAGTSRTAHLKLVVR